MGYRFPPVGAFYKDGACSFTVWAPNKEQVEVVVQNKSHALRKDDFGFWSVQLTKIHPGTEYKFRLDKQQELPDPASRSQPQDIHGPSSVVDPHFDWTDRDWKGLTLRDMIIYELHVGTFTKEGTFDGVISRLKYLKSLGVNAIEIMPVAQFPGSRNWGYDGVYPFAVQHSYGGVAGLKRLVNKAHAEGIAVILDVVYNHLGPEGNYFNEYGPYFTEKYKTPWGKAMNFDDAWSDGVRHFYWQNALMWLDEFHIDGLRLDAVHAIWDSGANHFVNELRKRVKELENASGTSKVLIAEFDLNNPKYISSPDQGGFGLDGQWIDEFHHALHSVITGETNGYYEDFGHLSHLAKAMQDSYVYTGEFSIHRKKFFGAFPEHNGYQFVIFAQNHDQIGNRMLGDRLTATLSYEQLKLVAATYLLSPQVPMLFMGEEYGEKNPFQYFISHTDKQLIEATRKGRREEFSYFKWEGEVPDPQAEETFGQCVLSWNYETDQQAAKLLEFYKQLIEFRRTRKGMQGRSGENVNVTFDEQRKLIVMERKFEGDCVVIVFNYSNANVDYISSYGKGLKLLLDSATDQWYSMTRHKPNATIEVGPFTILIFELEK
jgi:maltooligosyltrehalose trehalohydrolase